MGTWLSQVLFPFTGLIQNIDNTLILAYLLRRAGRESLGTIKRESRLFG
ncbi:hypothetical protein B14911_11707 [Bacillus sp. NRRL B-14911]|nr:hypothetical protein B14911_11707 [Bacillus sp. NRRL B-14911]